MLESLLLLKTEHGKGTKNMDNLKSKKKGRLLPKLGLWLLSLLALVFVGFPLLWMVLSSLKPSVELFKTPPSFFAKNPLPMTRLRL